MYWIISQFPELDHLDPPERAAVLRRVPWWTYPIILVRAAVLASVGGAVVGSLLGFSFHSRSTDLPSIAAMVVTGVLAVALYFAQLRRLRRLVRNEVAQGFRGRRPPFCFFCGYDLRAADTPRCPECGEAIGALDLESRRPMT